MLRFCRTGFRGHGNDLSSVVYLLSSLSLLFCLFLEFEKTTFLLPNSSLSLEYTYPVVRWTRTNSLYASPLAGWTLRSITTEKHNFFRILDHISALHIQPPDRDPGRFSFHLSFVKFNQPGSTVRRPNSFPNRFPLNVAHLRPISDHSPNSRSYIFLAIGTEFSLYSFSIAKKKSSLFNMSCGSYEKFKYYSHKYLHNFLPPSLLMLFQVETVYNNNNKFRRILLLPPSRPTAIFARRRRRFSSHRMQPAAKQPSIGRKTWLTATEFMGSNRRSPELVSINQFANPSRIETQQPMSGLAIFLSKQPRQMFSHFAKSLPHRLFLDSPRFAIRADKS